MYNVTISEDRILARRQINQHNIDTYCKGVRSLICALQVECYDSKYNFGLLVCNRCEIRDDMQDYPERSFLGFRIQNTKEFTWG